MTDEQIRLLLSLGSDEARLLLRNGEYALYRGIQEKMAKLVREYDLQLPLNCLQCFYYINGVSRTSETAKLRRKVAIHRSYTASR